MKKNIFQSVKQRMVSIALAAALVTSGIMAAPVTRPEVVEAATSTRTITKADSATAQWIDQQLRDGNSVKLYVKNQKNYAAVKKIMQSLQKKVSALNPYGCTFTFSKSGSFSKKKTTIKVKDSTGAYKIIDAAIVSYDSVSAFEADADTLATNLDAKMMDTNNWTDMLIIVNGSKSAITSACEKLNSKIQQVNKNSIIVNSTVMTVNKTNSWYGVKITEDNAKLYYYSNKFIDRVWEKAKSDIELCVQFNYAKENYTDEEWDAFYETETCQNYYKVSSLLKSNDTQRQLIDNAQNFCDLSTAMQLYAISATGYFTNMDGEDSFALHYYKSKRDSYEGQNWKTMKKMSENTLYGACYEFAQCEILLMNQLGIPCYYASGSNHAWSVAKVTNSDGKVMWVVNDYGIVTNMGSNIWYLYDGLTSSSVKNQIPSDHSYTITDFN